ncbi:DNA-binding Lrp family transcriptional regulator [Novosphingobium kunmingense]|uniref:DNA-binding Lrp family transcriptional regulator n=1 Tax=Novosphingobium kunmingense TaxID=1211806 RepID=A0A2N0H2Y0_9SPHN|nr:Lrp/AsnC family transcriptional regulator [Novosphingobium kunmingense]PKB13291.1 DNA-binding Lrp family transcriptional regulator [Novosphingobium kunmingense]
MAARRIKDQVDRQLIAELAGDPQISNRSLAVKLGVSESTVSLRIESLISSRLIRPTVQQNIVNSGFNTFGWLEVRCAYVDVDRIAATLTEHPNVFSISKFIEDPFLQVMVFASDMCEFKSIFDDAAAIDGVEAIEADVAIGDVCIKSGIAAL